MSLATFIRRMLSRSRPAAQAPQGSVPLRLSCRDLDAVPPAAELAAKAVVGHHVVLQFPRGSISHKQPLIERLAGQLPGHRVFDSGPGPNDTDCVTVYRVLDESVVLVHLPLFLAAIRDFADTDRNCCHALAAAHEIAAADLLARRHEIESHGGRVGKWKFCFYGFGCCFTHRRTGQVVDVRLGFGDEFGVIDPYFLARFIRSPASHREVAALLADDYHDPSRMLEVLHPRGHLRVIEVANSMLSGMVMRGLVLVSNTGDIAQRPVAGHSRTLTCGRSGQGGGSRRVNQWAEINCVGYPPLFPPPVLVRRDYPVLSILTERSASFVIRSFTRNGGSTRTELRTELVKSVRNVTLVRLSD